MPKCLNELSQEEFAQIKHLASLFFIPEEIAIMLELDDKECIEQSKIKGSPFFNAYHGGRYEGEIKVREGIVTMAKAGSTPAQTIAMDLIKKSKQRMA